MTGCWPWRPGAAGNPAVLTELIEGLRDERAVQVTEGQATLVSAELPARMNRVARQRLAGLSDQAQHLLSTAAVLGETFRLPDLAGMLGDTPAGLLPLVEETLAAGMVVADDAAFSFRQPLIGRALGQLVPRPARSALHRQFGELLLRRGESPAAAASHLLEAATTGDGASLAGLDNAAAELLPAAPQTAARLALRALDLTYPDAPGAPGTPVARARLVAAAEALTAAGRLDHAARLIQHGLAQPLPPVDEARLRCALSTILCASGQPELARAQAEAALAEPDLPADVRDAALTAHLQALAGAARGSGRRTPGHRHPGRTSPARRPGGHRGAGDRRPDPLGQRAGQRRNRAAPGGGPPGPRGIPRCPPCPAPAGRRGQPG